MKADAKLKDEIERYYLPKQLVNAIIRSGGVPQDSEETIIGIGFIDIVQYTFISKFLSLKENQEILNGLYTAFNGVLRRRGGYLNKLEGDSMMFQYGGLIDNRAQAIKDEKELEMYVARALFYTCVEMQQVCIQFNHADEACLDRKASETDKETLQKAFEIMKRIRGDDEVANPLNAMFQIRIRVGANVGRAVVGNFGPEGARQWDVIGMPVINAKRMEVSAPVGGLQISRHYYEILQRAGIIDEYHIYFCEEAKKIDGRYANISKDRLFTLKQVVLKDKDNATFETCCIQVNPHLPEEIANQVNSLLEHENYGANTIIGIIRYYRGNEFVIEAVEAALRKAGVKLRYADIFAVIYPKRYEQRLKLCNDNMEELEHILKKETTLYKLLHQLGYYQDTINQTRVEGIQDIPFSLYEKHLEKVMSDRLKYYEGLKLEVLHRMYFYHVVFPYIIESILAAILDYQARQIEILS